MRDTKALQAARAAQPDPYLRRFPWPKWNRLVTVCDEPKLFRRLPEFADYTKQQHETAAKGYLLSAHILTEAWSLAVNNAHRLYGDGDGQPIAGVYRDHFPQPIKDTLRYLAHTGTEHRARSMAHWLAAGKKQGTWLQMAEQFSVQ